jgi:hypothetical protein
VAIVYGTPLSGAQLDAVAWNPDSNTSISGTFSYSPVLGSGLSAGNHTLSVTFTPYDTADCMTITASVPLTVMQATPTVSWPTPASIIYGTGLSGAQLDATANVPGTFYYPHGYGTVLPAGNNTLSATFTPNDATDYRTVTTSVNLAVAQATPTITWAPPAAITSGTALSSTQLDATANVAGTFSYSPAAGTVLPVGNDSLSVTFTPYDSTDYQSVTTSTTISVTSVSTQTATWSVSIMNGSIPYWGVSNVGLSWFTTPGNESNLANWLTTCDTPGSGFSMTITTTVNSSVQSGIDTLTDTTTSTVSVANGVPSYEYTVNATLSQASDSVYYPQYYTLDIKDTSSTLTVNYSGTVEHNYAFIVQTSLTQYTPASNFGAQPPLLERLGSSSVDPYGLYCTDELYELALQRTTPYYSGYFTTSSGSFFPNFPDSSAGTSTYQMGAISPIITPGTDAEFIPSFSTTRIGPSTTPSPWTNYVQGISNGSYWQASTNMAGSDWNYSWYAANNPAY